MKRSLWKTLAAGCLAMLLSASFVPASDVVLALKTRNPYLEDLARRDPATFTKVALAIIKAERAAGLDPARQAPPPSAPAGRSMGQSFLDDKALQLNPDLLWLNNASPEGMRDLIGLLKDAGAGNKPKS